MPLRVPDRDDKPAGQKKMPPKSQPTSAVTIDPVWQKSQGALVGPTPFLDFDGPEVTDNGGGLAPPDPNIDVGPNHVIASVNLVTEIFDKSGNSVLGPFALNTLWQGFGGPCDSDNDGDPIVVYDSFADRWVLTQFAVTTGASECVAVSQGPDPVNDGWFLYEFDLITFPDYPKIGVTADAYLATYRNFGSSFDMQAAAMDRAAMLVGDPAVQVVFSITDASPASRDVDGFLPIVAKTDVGGGDITTADVPGNFIGFYDDDFGGTGDVLAYFKLTPDFNDPGSSTFTGPEEIPVAPFSSALCSGFGSCIPQPSPGGLLDPLSIFTMHQVGVRDVGGEISLVMTHAVDVDGTDRAGMRWHELRASGGDWTLKQEGTFAPDDGLNRWMGSIAQAADGTIGLGYSVSGTSLNPSIAHAFQTPGAPAGELNVEEEIFFTGGGVQTGGLSRWGDYSTMTTDPANPGTFWLINEYIPSNGSFNWKTRIAATTLVPDTDPPAQITDLSIIAPASVPQGASVTLEWTAVAEDGTAGTGTATSYDIRYSTTGAITDETDFDNATEVAGEPAPSAPGTTETFQITGLPFGTQIWFAAVAVDEQGNQGPVSNSPSVTTGAAPELTLTPDFIDEELEPEQQTTVTLALANDGDAASTLDFSFPAFAATALLRATPESAKNNRSPLGVDTGHAKGEDDLGGIGHDVILGAGGPDGFGYEWIDSNEPGGPVYAFTDISTTGTLLAINDDFAGTTSVPVDLSFTFPFYGEEKTTVRVDNNGMLFFDGAAGNYFSNQQIPNPSAPNGVIAPFWDDLNPDAGDCAIYAQDDGDQLIVQYTDCQRFANSATVVTFQVILDEDGSILFLYEDLTGTLNSATVGIESPDGSDGLQVAFNTTYVENSLAVFISVPPDIVASIDPVEGSVAGGNSVDIDVTLTSADLLDGIYEADISLLTNDPDESSVLIPVTLTVGGGTPDITVDPTSLTFADAFVGASNTETFEVINDGNGVLDVTAINSNSTEFTVENGALGFMLNPGDSETITVTFAPEAVGPRSGTITVESSDPDEPTVAVSVSGTGTPPPDIEVDPESFDVTVEILQSVTETLTISNVGASTLEWMIMFSGSGTPDGARITPEEVAAPFAGSTGGSDAFSGANEGYNGAPTPAAPGSEIYQVDDGSSENSIGLTDGGDIMWLNAFQVVEGAESIFAIASAFGNSDSGISTGDPVRYILYDDPNNDGDPTDAVFLTAIDTQVEAPDTDTFNTEMIPDTEVEGVFFVAALYPNQAAGDFPAPIDQSSPSQGASWVVGSTDGPFNETNLGANNVPPLLVDDIPGLGGNWLLRADGTSAAFITFDPESGSIEPGNAQTVDVTFNAADLEVGTYTATIEVESNDPDEPVVEIPVTLTVEAAPFPFELDPESFDVALETDEMEMDVLNIENVTDEPQPFDLLVERSSGPQLPMLNPLVEELRREFDGIAAALAEQDQTAPSFGADPAAEQPAMAQTPGFGAVAPVGVMAFGTSVSFNGAFNGNFVAFDLGEPSNLGAVAPFPAGSQLFAGDYLVGETEFIIAVDAATGNLLQIDVSDGQTAPIGTITVGDGESVTDMATDGTDGTLYMSTTNGTETFLYTVDPEIGFTQLVGELGDDIGLGIAIAIDGNGELYVHEIVNDVIYKGDPETADVSLLGSTGVNANFAQSMDYDPVTGNIYMAWYQGGGVGGLRIVDPFTGATSLVGPFQGDEIALLALPSTPIVSFVLPALADGTLNPNQEVDVNLTFDATGLVAGVYTADLVVQSFVPGEPAEIVPITMTVDGDPDIDVSPLALDFGPVFRNGTSDVQQVLITNVGRDVLTFSLSLDNTDDFAYTPPSTFSLVPNSGVLVDVIFTPTSVGTINGTLTISSDDPDEGTVEVSLTGEGVAEPIIEVDPDAFTLQAYVGQQYDQTLTISNTGGSPLEWELTEENATAPPQNAVVFAELLSEDFNEGIPDDWTVVDNAGGAVWGINGDDDNEPTNYTGGTGTAASASADEEGGSDFDTELRTPTISTGGETQYLLEYTANYQNFASFDFLDTDISTDGGATWTTMLSWNEDHGAFRNTPGEDVTIDLAPFLDGATEFIVRWRYYDPTDFDFDWYAQIDDVVISAPLEWISEDPTSGTIAPGESQDVTLSIDATDLAPGVYTVDLVIDSNAPVDTEVIVPVQLTVVDGVTVTADTDDLDTINPTESFTVPITVSSLDFLEVESYQFELTFDPVLLDAVSVETAGTLSENALLSTNIDNAAGTITVAAADNSTGPIVLDPAALEGEGVLLNIEFVAGTEELGTSAIAFDSFLLNEGQPEVTTIDGEVTVGPLYGDASLNLTVNAFDAGLVLDYVVGLASLSPAALASADVSGNGTVNAFDAALIIDFTNGMISCFPVDPACGTVAATKQEATPASGMLVWGEASHEEGGAVTRLPLSIEAADGPVRSVTVTLPIDEQAFSVDGFEAALPEGWIAAHNVSDGLLHIALAGNAPLTNGTFGDLKLRWLTPDAQVTLTGPFFLNENNPQVLKGVDVGSLPESFELGDNYPNPFNPVTTITYQLPEQTRVTLTIYNALGQKVRTLVNTEQNAGRYKVRWDSRNDAGVQVASGTYLYRIEADNFVQTKSLVLVK